jgi:hypothetical protein
MVLISGMPFMKKIALKELVWRECEGRSKIRDLPLRNRREYVLRGESTIQITLWDACCH